MTETRDSFFAPLCIQGKYEDKCTMTSSTGGLLHPSCNSHPILSPEKSLSSMHLSNSDSSEFNATPSAYENSSCKETSFYSHEPHPHEDSFTSYLSLLNETEFEFNSSPCFRIETFFPREQVRKLKPSSSSLSQTSARKNSSLQRILKLIRIALTRNSQ